MFKRSFAFAICLLSFYGESNAFSAVNSLTSDFTSVADKGIPAVVSIQVKSPSTSRSYSEDSFGEDFFSHFFFMPHRGEVQKPPVVGQASGFIVSPDGYILTSGHVVKDATEIDVILEDGRELTGKLIGQDSSTDVALIKIDAKELPYLQLGNSDDIKVGQWAVAIGNPYGLQATLTVGVISAKSRNNLDLASVEDFIQTDAAVNRGNSGGPLLNIDGQVIGINTAIVSNNGSGSLGIGFAVPSNIAKHVMDQLMKTGEVVRGFLGVDLQAVDKDLAQAFNLNHEKGVLIANVLKGSPAAQAGLKQGDVIQSLNQHPVVNIGSLRTAIALSSPGTKIRLTVLRNGETIEIPVELGQFPSTKAKTAQISDNKLGFEVQNLTGEIARNLGLKEDAGVVIVKVDANTPAAWAGLKKGAIILAVNKIQVNSVEEFYEILHAAPAEKPILLLVKQGEVVRFISLKI